MTRSRLGAFTAVLATASAIFACAGAPPRPAVTAKPELSGVRLYVPPKAELGWSDNDCADKASGLAVGYMQTVAGELSRAGFAIVTDPAAPVDAKVSLRANLEYCGVAGAAGPGSLSIEPGAVASGTVGVNKDSPVWYWEHELVKQLIESPKVLALGHGSAAPPAATTAGEVAKPSEAASPPPPPAAPPPPPAAAPPAAAALAHGAQQPNAFALVVGIENYRDAPPPPGARADAESFKAVATTTLGVPAKNVRVLVDERASRTDIERELAWLKANVPQDGKVIFFFAGHGAPDASSGTSYLLPYDGTPDAIGQTALPLASVMKSLGETKARHVVAFVDACFSGAGGRSVLPKGARPLVRVKETTPQPRVALFVAASGAQISGPAADGKSGLFSRFLGEAMGGAQADIDGDGMLTLDEVSRWVTPRVAREAQRQSREQNPSLTLPAHANPSSFVLAVGVAR